MKKVKLLPEQIKVLEEKLEKLRQEKHKMLDDYSNNQKITQSSSNELSDPQDFTFRINLHQINENIKEIESLLNESKQINLDDYNQDIIDVGTHFSATIEFDGEIENDEYVLVSDRNGSSKERKINFISEESPLGKVVKGKKIGDSFHYTVGNNVIVGFIEDISTIEEINEYQKRLKK